MPREPMSSLRRLRGGDTLSWVASRAGLSAALLSQIERGNRSLTWPTAKRLALVLCVEPGSLMAAELSEAVSSDKPELVRAALRNLADAVGDPDLAWDMRTVLDRMVESGLLFHRR